MVRPIVRSRIALQRPAEPATPDDAPLGQDLLDTLAAHADDCVGLAANMVGASKAAIAFCDERQGRDVVMYNPRITRKAGPYQAIEGCLSLPGECTVTRYRRITVEFDDESFRHRTASFEGFTAQVIQHEVDHCAGILV